VHAVSGAALEGGLVICHVNRAALPPRWLLRVLLLVIVVVVAAACTPGAGMSVLRAEPALAPPGDAAIELGRSEREPEWGPFLGNVSGYVQVIHASPEAPEKVVEWYRETQGAHYAFSVNDRYLSASGRGTATVLTASRADVRVSVRVDTAAPAGPDAPELSPPPVDTVTIVTVIVQSP
jgi:hypothetical protein